MLHMMSGEHNSWLTFLMSRSVDDEEEALESIAALPQTADTVELKTLADLTSSDVTDRTGLKTGWYGLHTRLLTFTHPALRHVSNVSEDWMVWVAHSPP